MASENEIEINIQPFVATIANAALGNGTVAQPGVDFVAERGDKRLIVVAAAPKTGSTFLANTLHRVTGYPYFRLSSGYGTNEHDLYLPALCMINRYGCVSQLHMKGTYHNAAHLNAFGIKPVILVRQIDDIVVSLVRDLRQKESLPGFGIGQNGYSFLWLDEETQGLTDPQLTDMVIDLAVPWFVNFYVSWQRLCAKGMVDAMWVSYEDMMADKMGTLKRILRFVGFPCDEDIDTGILEQKYSTYRDGRSHHGREVLSEDQKQRIRRHFSYYSGVDFGMYGI